MSQAEFKKRLKALMNKPENQICSDCPERKPTWASLIVPPPGSPPGSLPIGAFCCLECSGSHRRLGVHISFVRSVNLDSWKQKEVLSMENGGNKKVNAIFEARLAASGARKPTNVADGPTRERFIRDKYERRKYFDPAVLQGYPEEDSSSSEEEEEEARPVRRASRANPPAPRPPSEAARRRIESRQARLGGTSLQTAAPVRVEAPAPAPAAQVDLLDFGAFSNATPAPAPATSSPAAAPVTKTAEASPNIDLFAAMTVSNGPTPTPAPTPAKKATTNDQILAMFGAPAQQQPTMNGGMMMGSMMNPQSNNMAMMQPNNTMMAPNPGTGMLQQAPNPGMMQQQQTKMNQMMMQQQQPKMNPMMMQQPQTNMMTTNNTGMMMMQQNPNMMGNMMQQQQQQQQQNGNMMPGMMMQTQQTGSTDAFGFPQAPMGSGPPISRDGPGMIPSGNAYQAQAPVTTDDPFAQFGTNAFRS